MLQSHSIKPKIKTVTPMLVRLPPPSASTISSSPWLPPLLPPLSWFLWCSCPHLFQPIYFPAHIFPSSSFWSVTSDMFALLVLEPGLLFWYSVKWWYQNGVMTMYKKNKKEKNNRKPINQQIWNKLITTLDWWWEKSLLNCINMSHFLSKKH